MAPCLWTSSLFITSQTSQMEHNIAAPPCRQRLTRQLYPAASCRWICAGSSELKRAASEWQTEPFTLHDTSTGKIFKCSPSSLCFYGGQQATASFLALSCQSSWGQQDTPALWWLSHPAIFKPQNSNLKDRRQAADMSQVCSGPCQVN